jgi:O-antigen/teichoic acid export membrane protein
VQPDRAALRNVGSLLVAQSVAVLAGMLAFTRIGRELQVRELGRFGFAISSTAFFGLAAELGIRYVAMREIALRPDSTWTIHRHASSARWLLSVASLVVLALVSSLGMWKSERSLLLLAGLVAITQFGADAATWVCFGRGRVDFGAALLVLDRLLYVAAVHAAAILLPTAEGLVGGALAANLARMMIALAWARHRFPKEAPVEWSWPLFRKTIVGGAGLGSAVIASVAYGQISIVLAKLALAPEDLGYYAMAFGIVSVLVVIPTSITMALFPMLAVRLSEGEAGRRQLTTLVLRLNLCTALPLAAVLIVFPREVLAVWMGPQYLASASVLRVMAVAVALSAVSFMYRLFLFAADRYRFEALLDIGAILVVLGAGPPLCRHYGTVGAGLTLVATETLVVLCKVAATRRWLGHPPLLGTLAPVFAAAAIPSLMVSLLDGVSASARLLLLVGGIVGLLVPLCVLPSGLWRTLRRMATPSQVGTAAGGPP